MNVEFADAEGFTIPMGSGGQRHAAPPGSAFMPISAERKDNFTFAPGVVECCVSPNSVCAGDGVTLKVRISDPAPAGGFFVSVETKGTGANDSLEPLPGYLMIPGGATCGWMRLQTRKRHRPDEGITFVATAPGSRKRASFLSIRRDPD